jgi:hypothetical protein
MTSGLSGGFVSREIAQRVEQEWRVSRLQREVVPVRIQRRRQQQHAALTDAALEQRDAAVVVARDHLVGRGGLECAVAEHACERQIDNLARAEGRCDWMCRGEVRDSECAAAFRVDALAGFQSRE